MVSFADLRDWASSPLDETVTAANTAVTTLVGLADELHLAAAPDGWSGDAATAARARRGQLVDGMESLVAEIAAVRGALGEAADSALDLSHEVAGVIAVADAHQFVIRDDGSIIDAPMTDAGDPAQRDALRRVLAEDVAAVLRHATTIDDTLTSVLERVERGEITDDGATTLAGAAEAGDAQGSLHDRIMSRYQVSVDPGGLVEFPSGALGWMVEVFGFRPQMLPASEADLLYDLGAAGIKDAYDIYRTAQHTAENTYGNVGEADGHSDAFRHAYWNAMLANRFGPEWTEQYTTAHERAGTNAAATEAMDLHNNEVGRRIAAEHPGAGPEELARYVDEAVRNGEMVVLAPDGTLVRSNEVDLGKTGNSAELGLPTGETGHDPRPADPDQDHTSGGYNYGGDGDSYGTYS